MIKWAIITNPSKDTDQFSVSQNSYYGTAGKAYDAYPYGLHAVPPEGTLALVFNVRGDEDNQAQIPLADQLRTKDKKPGEVEGGNMLVGSVYIFKENGDWNIEIKGDVNLNVDGNVNITAKGETNVTAPTVNLLGNVNLGSGGKAIARKDDVINDINSPFSPIGRIGTASTNHTAT